MKALISYFRSAAKSANRIKELEKALEKETNLRRKYQHEVSVWEAKWENRDT